jgi:hypothetical protein
MAKQRAKVTAGTGKQEFFIEREFDAPRELVPSNTYNFG